MRTRIKVEGLTLAQWDYIQTNLRRDYEFGPTTVRVCVELEMSPDLTPKHVEMPVRVFMAMMNRLQRIGAQAEVAEAALSPDTLPDHLEQVRDAADPARFETRQNLSRFSGGGAVAARNNCAFCHRERTAKDDNHAPECPYWTVGPGSL